MMTPPCVPEGIHTCTCITSALAKAKQGRREGGEGEEGRGGEEGEEGIIHLFKPSWLPYSSVVSSLTEVSCSSWPVCSGVEYSPAGL